MGKISLWYKNSNYDAAESLLANINCNFVAMLCVQVRSWFSIEETFSFIFWLCLVKRWALVKTEQNKSIQKVTNEDWSNQKTSKLIGWDKHQINAMHLSTLSSIYTFHYRQTDISGNSEFCSCFINSSELSILPTNLC